MDDPAPKIICVECGERVIGVIPKFKDGKPLCRSCAFRFESGDRSPRPGSPERTDEKWKASGKSSYLKLFRWVVLGLSLFVFTATLPRMTASLAGEKPARIGDARMGRQGDHCINNLWETSKALQNTGSPVSTLTCPASGEKYIVEKSDVDMIISCPSLELHRVKSLSVSRKHPFPEVVQ